MSQRAVDRRITRGRVEAGVRNPVVLTVAVVAGGAYFSSALPTGDPFANRHFTLPFVAGLVCSVTGVGGLDMVRLRLLAAVSIQRCK